MWMAVECLVIVLITVVHADIWGPAGWLAAQKVLPHIFFLGNYLFGMYAIHAQYNWIFPLHMWFFHIISIYVYSLTPVRNKSTHVSLYQLVSCSRSHVLTARIMLSSSSNLVPRSAFFSGPKGWKPFGPMEWHHQQSPRKRISMQFLPPERSWSPSFGTLME